MHDVTTDDPPPTMPTQRDRSTRSGSRPAWVGDFEIEQTGRLERLYRLAGIDPREWIVCGVDVRLSYGQGLHAGVFAVERDRLSGIEGGWQDVADRHDRRVPVTEFRLQPALAPQLLALFPDVSLVAAEEGVVPRDGVELNVVESVLTARTGDGGADPAWRPG